MKIVITGDFEYPHKDSSINIEYELKIYNNDSDQINTCLGFNHGLNQDEINSLDWENIDIKAMDNGYKQLDESRFN